MFVITFFFLTHSGRRPTARAFCHLFEGRATVKRAILPHNIPFGA
jgi:hypothetical protein